MCQENEPPVPTKLLIAVVFLTITSIFVSVNLIVAIVSETP